MIILQPLAHPTEDKCPFKPKVKSAQKNGESVREEKKRRESIDLRLVTLLNKGFQTPGFTTVHVRSMKDKQPHPHSCSILSFRGHQVLLCTAVLSR